MTEHQRHFLSIVVPVYNEEESLEPFHTELSETLEAGPYADYEVIYVDDGSIDTSYAKCCSLFDRDPEHVRVIRLRRNFGQTAAMAAGFDAAKGDVIVPMDADLQNDPRDIARLVEKIDQGFDVVSGWRAERKDAFIHRRLPSILANVLIARITGVPLHDFGCTLKAYRRDVIGHIQLYGELHRFLPALASWGGAEVAELKVNHRARKYGRSKVGLGRTLRVIMDLITVKFLLTYSTKPMQVFGKWGFLLLVIGMLAALYTFGLKVFENRDVTENPWLNISIFFSLGGLQLLSIGLLGEINVRTYYESQQKPIYTIREEKTKE